MGLITGNLLPVTSFYAGILSVAVAVSALAVTMAREANKTYYGTGAHDSVLQHRVRANGTLQEYGIWILFLLALLEYNQVLGSTTLWWAGLILTVLRITHALQLSRPSTIPLGVRIFSYLVTIFFMIFAGFKLAASGCSA